MKTLLEIEGVSKSFGSVVANEDISLTVKEGEILALLGENGAGKSTTLKAISGLLASERGDITKGKISYRGNSISAMNPSDLVKMGVIQVMEGRHCFEHLTVEENLLTGAYTRTDGNAKIQADLEKFISNPKNKKIQLHLHPFIAAYLLKGVNSIRFKWYLKHKKWITIIPRDAYTYLHYRFKSPRD